VQRFNPVPAPGTATDMTEDTDTQQGSAPSEPDQDPKQNPAPPANPPTDQEAVRKSEEGLDKISGH
jgi:hypothetical protein